MTLKLYSNGEIVANDSPAQVVGHSSSALHDSTSRRANYLDYITDMVDELTEMARHAGFQALERKLRSAHQQAVVDHELLTQSSS